ncbi:transposase [Arthrobacter sp. efr-133-R2A-63]|uniref:RNA-guided endonuclease InsQ/TnpB family protein n=1 Tax=Arthrobacter sp. efr-133-R2A-63 TaxID=3040278 RepID=UPI00254C213B|nr:transposase [Arthrobacter sp. efr-133-R2A-63]
MPWSGFDLINAFNAWKRSDAAGRVFAVDGAGAVESVVTGLSWRTRVCQQVFEEAALPGIGTLRVHDDTRPLRRILAKNRRLSKAVSRKKKGSKNRAKAVTRLARHHEHIRNRRQHFRHQASNELAKTHARLAIEDLDVTGMLANHHLAAAIADATWAELARQLAYKQSWRNGELALVDRWFPSSKTCSQCGHARPGLGLGERAYECGNCGLAIDRDLNAAANLAAWAQKHHAQAPDPEARAGTPTPADTKALAPAPARTKPS